MMIRILLLLTLTILSSGQTSSLDEKFLVTLRSNVLRYAEHNFYPNFREQDVSNNLETRAKSGTVTRSLNRPGYQINPAFQMLISKDSSGQTNSFKETRAKSGTVTRSLNRPGDHLFPTNRMLISKDSSAQLENGVGQTSSFEETRTKTGTVTRSLNRPGDQLFPTDRLLISKDSSAQFESGVGQISSFEETRAKSGTVTRSLNRPGDQLFPTNRMLISKDSSGQTSSFEETRTKSGTVTRSLNRPGDQLFPTNRMLISKDSSAQLENGVGQISSFEETRAKSGTVTRSLNRPGDQLSLTNRMLISKDSSGQTSSFEETRTKTGTVTRSLNRPGDQLFPTNRLLISKDSSAQFESGVGQISSFEETRSKSGTVTRSLNRPGDQLFPTNRMLISKDSSGYSSSFEETRAKSGTVTRSLNRPDNHLFPTNRILISKDSSAQVESRVGQNSDNLETRTKSGTVTRSLNILPAISKKVISKYGFSAQDAMANFTDILLKMSVEGANTTIERSELSEMLNTLSLWENILGSKTSQIPTNLEDYHSQWIYLLKTFPINGLSKHQFQNLLNPLTYEVSTISAHFIDFSKLFWPFIYELCDNNQKLAIVGMTRESMNHMNQKTTFFEELSKLQNMKIPADENKIIYSFDDEELVRGMHRTGLETFDKDFVQNGSHRFTKDEQEEITRATDAALDLINSTLPEVYKAINRLVGCIAFYKSQSRVHMGGTVSSAIGLIWLDPSTQKPWSIAFYAEQIVHEFIHTSLFYADLVHGMFRDPSRLSEAKVMSAIRRQMRDYDTSLHAAYVSTGLVTFHARAGYFERALALAEPLERSVKDLELVDREHGVLDESGKAILKSLVDYLVAMRLYN